MPPFPWPLGDSLGIRIDRNGSANQMGVPWVFSQGLIRANGLGSRLVFWLIGAMATPVSTARAASEVMRLGEHQVSALKIPIGSTIAGTGGIQGVRGRSGNGQWFNLSLGKRHGSRCSEKEVPIARNPPPKNPVTKNPILGDPISRPIHRGVGGKGLENRRKESPGEPVGIWQKFSGCSVWE